MSKTLGNKTTHQLARELLSLPDLPVVHHYYFHEDFRDDGFDWFSEVGIKVVKGVVYLTEGYDIDE